MDLDPFLDRLPLKVAVHGHVDDVVRVELEGSSALGAADRCEFTARLVPPFGPISVAKCKSAQIEWKAFPERELP